MATLFSKIAKAVMTVGGSILSLVPGLAAIGVPIIVAGQAINTKDAGTIDKVSVYGDAMATTLNSVAAMQASQKTPGLTIGTNQVIEFVKSNLLIILLVIAGVFIVPKLISGRRR
jgi:hypothetical protein